MILAIDWDGTWAAYPDLFRLVALHARSAGLFVVVVTNRPVMQPIEPPADFGLTTVLYCGGRPKRQVVREWNDALRPPMPVIWIDDNPILVDLGQRGLDLVGRAPITREELYLVEKARTLGPGVTTVTTSHGTLTAYKPD